uniref:3-hydroxyisobutyryl-CoA hydrolase n=1 Tax=Solanum lycopersicum TaxID=4081 RepID=A0A3Q7ESY9_SOLLC
MLREFVRCSFPLAYFDTLWQGNMLVLLVLGWMELKCLLVVLQPTLYHRIHQESKFDSHRQQLSKTSPTKILNGTPNHQNNNTGKGKKKKVQWIAQQNTLQPSSSNRQAKAPSQYNLERSKHPPEVIIYAESEVLDKKDDWISSTIQSLKKAPPTSLKISLRSHPFYCITRLTLLLQGCRAILIDRDRNPKISRFIHSCAYLFIYIQWEPSRLEIIRDDDVDHYFSKIDDEDWEDLKLPPRSNMSPYAIVKL